jgi:hypothetical protein
VNAFLVLYTGRERSRRAAARAAAQPEAAAEAGPATDASHHRHHHKKHRQGFQNIILKDIQNSIIFTTSAD